ncbi:glycosyltransferase [Synechococcales cyanobacterium C]|uniref:Glycosyltransferase n=2 Tax=Petrachloros TaxID=2918834 RepID=A0A8K2A080_9CYAN|nr:glycosyltransferase [Petrachloros mirabilis ULC683]
MWTFWDAGAESMGSALAMAVLVVQLPAIALVLSRLLRGSRRLPPLVPCVPTPDQLGSVSIVVPTLNEAHRIEPCLRGLSQQSYEVREILVVDSCSQDGTPARVQQASHHDPRIRLLTDDPLPPGWVGRPWALHSGYLASDVKSEWILGIDADTQPQPGLIPSLIAAAEIQGYDLVSLAPRFILRFPGEVWLQPALLMTLIYRFGAAGETANQAERVMANGQCFLCRRSLLTQLGGFEGARRSFCDDVTLARHAANQGAKVGFLDGAPVLKVRMYEGALETWQEWGRSLDLKDASSRAQTWGDLWLLSAVQGLPLIVIGLLMGLGTPTLTAEMALGLNLSLVAMRWGLQAAILPSYDLSQALMPWLFWLSPLADPLAVLRIWLSALQTPKQWRGRVYSFQP